MNEIRIYTYLLLQEILFPDGYDFVNFKKAVKEYEVWKTVNSEAFITKVKEAIHY